MKLDIQFGELSQERNRSYKLRPDIHRDAWAVLRMHAFELERRIKTDPPEGMPVDTGRAKGSWGHSTAPALGSDGIWIEDEPGLSVIEGTNVTYVEALNEGSSQQSPAGFIDRNVDIIADLLSEALADYIEDRL